MAGTHRLAAGLALVVVVGACSSESDVVGDGPTEQVLNSTQEDWEPDPGLLEQLAPPAPLPPDGAFTMRPPAGFELTRPFKEETSSDVQWWSGEWQGPRRKGLFGNPLHVSIRRKVYDREQDVATRFLNINFGDHNISDRQFRLGRIDGMRAVCCHWSGTHQVHDYVSSGVIYVICDGEFTVLIALSDIEPFNQETLPLAEAAARTFRKAR
jgi:hypothetical protein